MAMKKTHRLVATIGEYTNSAGETKKRYLNVGSLFTDAETGRMSVKMDAIPAGQEWSGWLAVYDEDDDRQQNNSQAPQQRPPSQQPARQSAQRPQQSHTAYVDTKTGAHYASDDDDADEIPF